MMMGGTGTGCLSSSTATIVKKQLLTWRGVINTVIVS
jgi:hypothetical protein